MSDNTLSPYITMDKFAAESGMERDEVYQLIESNGIPAKQFVEGGRWFVNMQALRMFAMSDAHDFFSCYERENTNEKASRDVSITVLM